MDGSSCRPLEVLHPGLIPHLGGFAGHAGRSGVVWNVAVAMWKIAVARLNDVAMWIRVICVVVEVENDVVFAEVIRSIVKTNCVKVVGCGIKT